MISIYSGLIRICVLSDEAEEKFVRGIPKIKIKKRDEKSYIMMEDKMFSPGHGVKIDLAKGSTIIMEE